MRIRRLAAILTFCMILISSPRVSSQEGVSVEVEPREDPCIAGFPCELAVSILNAGSNVLLSKLKLITPWGAFIKELGLRELKAGGSLRVPITVNVSADSLEGPNFVRPELMYYVRGKTGIYYSAGNFSAILVRRPKINATLLASPLSYTVSLGEALIIEGSYKVEGIPRDFNPSILVLVDGNPVIERTMNSSRGVFSMAVPIADEGIHSVNIALCYAVGCTSRSFSILVKGAPPGYSKSDLLRDLNSTKKDLQDLVSLYKKAVNDAIPIPSGILQNITAVDSLLAEAESRLNRNLTLEDAERVRELLNRSESLISLASGMLIDSYRRVIISEVSYLRKELSALAKLDEGAYRNLSYRLDSIEEKAESMSKENAPVVYEEAIGEIREIRGIIRSRREKVASDAAMLALSAVSLMIVSIVSTAMLILRRWRRSVKGAKG